MKERVTDQVYDSLKDDILSGRFTPNEKLTMDRLAKIKHVSHTPIREALGKMAHDGLVEFVPHRGAFVKKITFDEALEILEIRCLLETRGAFCLADLGVKGETLDTLKKINRRFRKAKTIVQLDRCDYYFHKTLLDSHGTGLAGKLMENQMLLLNAFRLNCQLIDACHMEKITRSTEEHQTIIQAIENHDPKLASKTMKKHLMAWILEMNKLKELEGNAHLFEL